MKPKKKNKFFTYLCSLIPGAAQMYSGFFRLGLSMMIIFLLCSVCLFVSGLRFLFILTAVPMWFAGFFYSLNMIRSSDIEFREIKDDYIWNKIINDDRFTLFSGDRKRAFLITAIVLGALVIWGSLTCMLNDLMPDSLWGKAYPIFIRMPQMLIALAVVIIGIRAYLHICRQENGSETVKKERPEIRSTEEIRKEKPEERSVEAKKRLYRFRWDQESEPKTYPDEIPENGAGSYTKIRSAGRMLSGAASSGESYYFDDPDIYDDGPSADTETIEFPAFYDIYDAAEGHSGLSDTGEAPAQTDEDEPFEYELHGMKILDVKKNTMFMSPRVSEALAESRINEKKDSSAEEDVSAEEADSIELEPEPVSVTAAPGIIIVAPDEEPEVQEASEDIESVPDEAEKTSSPGMIIIEPDEDAEAPAASEGVESVPDEAEKTSSPGMIIIEPDEEPEAPEASEGVESVPDEAEKTSSPGMIIIAPDEEPEAPAASEGIESVPDEAEKTSSPGIIIIAPDEEAEAAADGGTAETASADDIDENMIMSRIKKIREKSGKLFK